MELDLKELDRRLRETLAALDDLLREGPGELVWRDDSFQVQGAGDPEPEAEGLLLALNELGYHVLRHRQEVHAVVPQRTQGEGAGELRIPKPFARSETRGWLIYRADYMAEHTAESLEEGGVPALVRPAYILPAVVSAAVLDRIFAVRDTLGETADGRADGDWLVAAARGRDEG